MNRAGLQKVEQQTCSALLLRLGVAVRVRVDGFVWDGRGKLGLLVGGVLFRKVVVFFARKPCRVLRPFFDGVDT